MPVGGNFTNCNCGPAAEVCASPTQPVATVGLCLADGSPIAVTVVRDCTGTTTSEGWINLTTGAWSAGAPPAGTIACGDSRSITTNGTFCDVAPDTGDVLGLVLVEYQYAPDGSIAAVRLVDAVTGDTYTPQGEVTTCPAGVEQPERDLVQLCDVTDAESGAGPMPVPFLRDYQRDETGQITGHSDYTLDGAPYTVTGEVGQCEQAPPEQRVDVETAVLCVVDDASGDVLSRVLAEYVYDDQSGERITQRLIDLATGEEAELPAGATLTTCPTPDRITRQVCVVESGRSEFLTNAANATSGQDTDWRWAPNLSGTWYPMYRVAPNAAWTVQDSAPNKAHWVSPHQSRSVCSPNTATAPNVPGTWYTRASWNLPADADPESIRVAATVLNADNAAVQWRFNDGAWQTVAGGVFIPPAWTFPATAVPGGRAGQNEIVVQLLETQPGVSCPSPNESGMMLHVIATYDHAPKVWTQVIEPGGQTYYLDEDGARQAAIPENHRIVPCGSGDGAACCPWQDAEPLTLCDTAPDGTVTQFLRHLHYVEGAQAPTVTDTALDGVTAYTPSGVVGVCPDEGRDIEVLQLCDLVDGAAQVPFLRHLAYLPGRTTPVVIDTALDGVTPYTVVGEAGQCAECPAVIDTECVGVIERTEASYDNTSLIGGVPGKCGSVQGPGGQFSCETSSGPYTITSWIVDGIEVIADAGKQFAGGPCGPGTSAAPGMHLNWAQALTNLDPTGATWTAQNAEGCAWHIRSSGGTGTVYGPMTITGNGSGAPNGTWILGSAQGCSETQYTKVYTQECDGTFSVKWLTAEGVETDAPAGDYVRCGTGCGGGSGGQGTDAEPLLLCDLQPDGTIVQFIRHLVYDADGAVSLVVDTGLDGITPYTPSGLVGTCTPPPGEARDVELVPLCVLDNATGASVQEILAEFVYDEAGAPVAIRYVDRVTGAPVAMPGGTHLGVCPGPAEERHVVERCLCDDTNGDGTGDTDYVELVGVDTTTGALTPIGTYTTEYEPYTPVAPVPCETGGAPSATGVQAHRVELVAGQTWSASAWPTLQSVTAVARGAGTVTAADGVSTLVPGEAVTWSVARDSDASLTGPLTIGATDGTVAVAFTTAVTL